MSKKRSRPINGFVEIARILRAEIIEKKLAANSRLPTERELGLHFGTTRITVRRALRLLEEEQLIRRLQGSGTYVRPSPQRVVPVSNNSSRSFFLHAPSLRREVVAMEEREAEDWLAGDTRIRAGTKYLHVEYTLDLRAKRFAHGKLALLYPYAKHATREDAAETDFFKRWSEKGGFTLTNCEHHVRVPKWEDQAEVARTSGFEPPVLRSIIRYKAEINRFVAVELIAYAGSSVMLMSSYPWEP